MRIIEFIALMRTQRTEDRFKVRSPVLSKGLIEPRLDDNSVIRNFKILNKGWSVSSLFPYFIKRQNKQDYIH